MSDEYTGPEDIRNDTEALRPAQRPLNWDEYHRAMANRNDDVFLFARPTFHIDPVLTPHVADMPAFDVVHDGEWIHREAQRGLGLDGYPFGLAAAYTPPHVIHVDMRLQFPHSISFRRAVGDALARQQMYLSIGDMHINSGHHTQAGRTDADMLEVSGEAAWVRVDGSDEIVTVHRGGGDAVLPGDSRTELVEKCRKCLQEAGLIPSDIRGMEYSVHRLVSDAIGSGKPEEKP